MQELLKIIIGIILLILGHFIGNILAKITKDESQIGQKWFKLIVTVSLICGLISLVLGNDVLLFSFFFIAIVTARSLR